ncbi:odorant receptor Or2-like [Anthonomus grandis grandis]|uniref:odorant receptor Or2-like n=1 Tax=Anthonomus grandis grandis TaxID=2921223 RepID=UPI0021651D86|nr:odorant receptor Or2-like [Anthonomus grandis grandis]
MQVRFVVGSSVKGEKKTRIPWRKAIATTETVLKITGIWPQEVKSYWSSIRLFVFITLSLIFDITIIVELRNLMRTQDYEALSTHLSTFGLYIGYSIKILIFQFKKKNFLNMLSIIDLPIFEDYPPRMEKYKTDCISMSNGIANFYISCVAISVFMYLNKPLYTDASLPISFSYDLNSLTYVLILALQCFGNYYLVMIGISFDMIIIGLINIATAQLDILGDTIVGFRAKNFKCIKEEEHAFFKQCVKRHQTIIRFVNETENIFTFIFLTQCLSSVTSICNGAFQLTHTGKLWSIHFIFNCAFAFDVLFEIGICCWFAGLLTIKSLEVADACYNYTWLNSPASTKKLLLIILMRSQRPLYITAGKYARLSMTSFLMVLKTAYSYFALMQSLYDKKNSQ